MRKGRKSTKGMVIKDDVDSGPGKGASNADMIEYTPPMVQDDLRKIKHRISKATYKGRQLTQLARVFTVDSLSVFAECLYDETANRYERMAAAKELLDRGWGKASQVIAGDGEKPISITIKWDGEG
jgi:hypothetical protein